MNHRLTYPVLWDPDMTSSPKFKNGKAIPYNVVVDEKGIVRLSVLGWNAAALKTTITELLGKRSSKAFPSRPGTGRQGRPDPTSRT